MSRTIELFYDFVSPAAYLAWAELPGVAARRGAELVLRPFLLGGVFKTTGNAAPLTVPSKFAYLQKDFPRSAERLGVPLVWNPHFPINTVALMRGAIAHRDDGRLGAYTAAIFRAMWVDGRNLADDAVVADVLQKSGFDPAAYAADVQRPDVKQALIASTEEAVKRGAFGAPTIFVGDEMFFGHDRVPTVEWFLKKQAG